MSLLRKLSSIDNRTKYSVNGWIHESKMIGSMCILFFRDDEIFDIIGKNVKASSNKKCITKLMNHWYKHSCGIMEISSMSDLICKWDLKISTVDKEKEDIKAIFIGIASGKDFKGHVYGYIGFGTIYKMDGNDNQPKYGDEYGDDDISIKEDLKQGEMRFLVNGKDQGIAYRDIYKDKDVKYRLIVSICGKDVSVEIINFSKFSKFD